MAFSQQRARMTSKRVAPSDETIDETPPQIPVKAPPDPNETIFVSIPSYRDEECSHTVANCFEQATYPSRVFVGVFEQNHETEDAHMSCMDSQTALQFKDNIRSLRVNASEARGPIFARAVVETELFNNERYVLCIDSHTMFSPNWDVEVINQLTACDSSKPVLTCYPEEYDRDTHTYQHSMPSFLKFRDYHPRLGFPQMDRVRCVHQPSRPLRSLFWAAGFSFSSSDIVREVPFDPHLEYMFLGEEINMAVRLYTHGWDTFSPTSNVVYHYTPRQYRHVFWEQFYMRNGVSLVDAETRAQRKTLEKMSVDRVHSLLGGELDDPKYGLGSERTLAEFQNFCGLDLQNRLHTRHARWGVIEHASEEEQYLKFGGAY